MKYLLLCAAASVVLHTNATLAADGALSPADDGLTAVSLAGSGAERIKAADRLRTLSQEVASAACHYFNGVSVEESRELLLETKLETIRLLDALEFGDPALGIIGAETRRKTLEDIHKARAIWMPMEAAVLQLLDNPSDLEAVTLIKAQNDAFYELSAHLLSELSGEYAHPFELTQLDALLLDISGRLSMLTQRISKEACEIWTGNRSEDRIDALVSSVSTFHRGINALHDGYEPLGIIPAPTEEIKIGLEELVLDWDIVKKDLDAIIAG